MAGGLEERVSTLEREMGELRKIIIVGNGQPSLVSQVATMAQSLRSQVWVTRTTLGGVIAALLKLFFAG